MRRKQICIIGGSLLTGIAASILLPFSAWGKVSTELSIFFGLLGAALPQAMSLTMQAQPSQTLTISEASEFAEKLNKQQTYWFALFVLCGFGILLLLSGKVLEDTNLLGPGLPIKLSEMYPQWWPAWGVLPDFKIGWLFSGLVASQIFLLAIHVIGLGRGIISLQHLRGAAIQREAAQLVQNRLKVENTASTPFKNPPGYGDTVSSSPRKPTKRKAG